MKFSALWTLLWFSRCWCYLFPCLGGMHSFTSISCTQSVSVNACFSHVPPRSSLCFLDLLLNLWSLRGPSKIGWRTVSPLWRQFYLIKLKQNVGGTCAAEQHGYPSETICMEGTYTWFSGTLRKPQAASICPGILIVLKAPLGISEGVWFQGKLISLRYPLWLYIIVMKVVFWLTPTL